MMPKRLTCITPSFACPAGDRYSDAYLSGCLHEVAGSKDMLVQGNLVETGRRVPVPHKRTHESRPEVTNALLPYVSRPVCSGGTCLWMEFSNADRLVRRASSSNMQLVDRVFIKRKGGNERRAEFGVRN